MLKHLFMPASGDTLLRILRKRNRDERPSPRILGIDDWAIRKGRNYGTILVDLERHQVIDLLPDRTAETLATWLRAHPEIEVEHVIIDAMTVHMLERPQHFDVVVLKGRSNYLCEARFVQATQQLDLQHVDGIEVGVADGEGALQQRQVVEPVAKRRALMRSSRDRHGINYLLLDGGQGRDVADALQAGGLRLASGGTDNHLMLCDVTSLNLTGKIAEASLDRAGIKLSDLDLVDMHEAFAAQVLSVTKALGSKGFAEVRLGKNKAVGEVDEAFGQGLAGVATSGETLVAYATTAGSVAESPSMAAGGRFNFGAFG